MLHRTNQLLFTSLLVMVETKGVLLRGKFAMHHDAFNMHMNFYFTIKSETSMHCSFKYPQPNYCAFREASYGHSTLEIKNRTHALYHWNRNDDGKRVPTDQMVLHNQYWWVRSFMIFMFLASFMQKLNYFFVGGVAGDQMVAEGQRGKSIYILISLDFSFYQSK